MSRSIKHFSLTVILLISFTLLISAAPPKQWDKRYGGSGSDYARALQQTSTGGYIIAGDSASGIGGDKTEASRGGIDYWIVEIDCNGTKQWDKRFGGTGDDQAKAIQQTSDGGYIVAGESTSGIGGDKTEASRGDIDYWIVKVDSSGTKQWDKRFGGTSNDQAKVIEQTSDGGYIIAGESASGIGGDKTEASRGGIDYWIVKVDSSGIKQWDKRFGGSNNDYIYTMRQTSDGGYIIAGGSWSDADGDKTEASQGGCDYWIVKLDSSGTKQWDKRFGGTDNDWARNIEQTSDGGYIVAGYSFSEAGGDKTEASQGGYDYWIVKVDSSGTKQWDKRFGGSNNDWGISAKQISDGGYILAGYSFSEADGDKTEASRGGSDYWIVKVDSSGTKQWDKRFGGNATDYAYDIQQTSDGGYIALGFSASPISGDKTEDSRGGSDYWIVKLARQPVNDFDGDYKSDLAIFDNNDSYWYIKSLDNHLIAWAQKWIWSTATPITGDYDGDGISDLAVFDTIGGYWYIKTISGSLITWANQWGWSGALAVPGDYDSDGVNDLAIFDTAGGYWYIKTVSGNVITWANQWGWSTAKPVPGDYNGDGIDDLAVFDTVGGYWYIKTISGNVITWAEQWGWTGALAVPGDYDGDGINDLAIFDTAGGYWYIKTVSGNVITWANQWGWSTAVPVPGDYDGDGIYDLALFDTASGNWYIRKVSDVDPIIVWGGNWGWPTAFPVGKAE